MFLAYIFESGRQGRAWHGVAGQGDSPQAGLGTARQGSAGRFTAGAAWRGKARHGEARQFTAGVFNH